MHESLPFLNKSTQLVWLYHDGFRRGLEDQSQSGHGLWFFRQSRNFEQPRHSGLHSERLVETRYQNLVLSFLSS
jgi:hypothetical protein